MRYLYVDNYRGFQDTLIPIEEVNFLVGENSTGKSSILYLINLLGSPQFWFRQDFSNSEVKLGSFYDIVSKASDNKTYFRIGVVECDSKATFPSDNNNVFLLTFKKWKELPIVSSYSYVDFDKQVHVVFTSKSFKYKVAPIHVAQDFESTLFNTFRGWLEEPPEKSKGFKTPHAQTIPFNRRDTLLFVGGIIQRVLSEDEHAPMKRESFHVSFPTFSQALTWIAPIRSKPSRIYEGYEPSSSPEGDHVPHLVKSLLVKDKSAEDFESYMREFGQNSGLFENIYIQNFGRLPGAPFELGVKMNKQRIPISYVGYGVSQSLPIVVELYSRPHSRWFAIQQPEVHLHPKAQAALGNIFFNLANSRKARFFIETHSDYTINRFRTCCRDNKLDSQKFQSQILFFERTEKGNQVHPIQILDNGDYAEDQPKSFREFFLQEELNILGI